MPDLDISDDGTVNGFSNPESVKRNYDSGSITLDIPAWHGGNRVTKIAQSAFAGYDSDPTDPVSTNRAGHKIGKIIFPYTMREVGKVAFFYCENLTEVKLNDGLKTISRSAFNNCNKLKEIVIPNSVDSLGMRAFWYTNELNIINIPKGVTTLNERVFCYIDADELFIPSRVQKIDEMAIVNKSSSKRNLNLVFMSDDLELNSSAIDWANDSDNGQHLFAWCANKVAKDRLAALTKNGHPLFADGHLRMLTSYGDVYYRESDYNMAGLTEHGRSSDSVIVQNLVNHIPNFVFTECSESLRKIVFKGNNVTFGKYALFGVPKTTRYYVENSLVADNLKRLNVDDRQIFMSDGTFDFNLNGKIVHVTKNTQSTTIPTRINGVTLTGIDSNAFSDCSNITKVNFTRGSQITNFDADSFAGLSPDTEYYVDYDDTSLINQLEQKAKIKPDHIIKFSGEKFIIGGDNLITRVKLAALKGDNSITIPKNYESSGRTIQITGIGSNAFSECSDATKIIFDQEVQSLSFKSDTFAGLSPNTYYYVYKQHQDLIKKLHEIAGIKLERIVVITENFDITKTGLIVNVHPSSKPLAIPPKVVNAEDDEIPVCGIGSNAFSNYQNVNKITFNQSLNAIDITYQSFNFLSSSKTYYYVYKDQDKIIEALKQTAKIDDDHIIFSGTEFDLSKSGLIHRVNSSAISEGNLNIPAKSSDDNFINGIEADAFSECDSKEDITSITFKPNSQATKINPKAFNTLDLSKIIFYVDETSTDVLSSLKNQVSDHERIIGQGKNFQINASGKILKLNSQDQRLIIDATYVGISVTGIGSKAISDQNVKSIEFASGIKLTDQIASDAFAKLTNQPLFYVYKTDNATALLKVIKNAEIGVGNETDDLFTDFNDSAKLNGLTLRGRKQKELTLNDNINHIGLNAFVDCSSSLKKITIKSSSLTVDHGAFEVDSLKNIRSEIDFWVSDNKVKEVLTANKIKPNKIHLPLSPTSKTTHPNGLSSKSIGIIVGSICFAILLLGLGIGIPMRKQNKINVLNAKLTHKRIDKLSAANAMAFKKVVEATGSLGKQMQMLSTDMKALKAAVPQVSKKPNAKPLVNKASVKTSSSIIAKKIGSSQSVIKSPKQPAKTNDVSKPVTHQPKLNSRHVSDSKPPIKK